MSGWLKPWIAARYEVGCTVEIEQSSDLFYAHLRLDDTHEMAPGDRVHLHGPPLQIAFGQRRSERRTATVERAGWLCRLWTRLSGRLELHELYDVSFSPKRTL